jgi:hypothetical protein
MLETHDKLLYLLFENRGVLELFPVLPPVYKRLSFWTRFGIPRSD